MNPPEVVPAYITQLLHPSPEHPRPMSLRDKFVVVLRLVRVVGQEETSDRSRDIDKWSSGLIESQRTRTAVDISGMRIEVVQEQPEFNDDLSGCNVTGLLFREHEG